MQFNSEYDDELIYMADVHANHNTSIQNKMLMQVLSRDTAQILALGYVF